MTTLPSRVDALLIDLFETLVTVDGALLPTLDIGGRAVRSAIPAVLAELRDAHPECTAADVLAAMAAVRAEPPARRRADEEIEEHAAFAAVLRRLRLPDPADALARRLADAQMATIVAACRPMAGARSLLAVLRANGLRTAVVSNLAHADSLAPLLAVVDPDHRFDAAVTSIEVGFCKPDPRPFRAALARLDIEARHAVHLGDDPGGDVRGSAALGMHPVWFNPCRADWPGPDPAPTTVTDLGEVAELLGAYRDSARSPAQRPGSMAV